MGANMKLNPIGKNVNEVVMPDGVTILFSYQTPVAMHVEGHGFFRTTRHYSKTTSKHINKWLRGAKATEVEQAQIDSMVRP